MTKANTMIRIRGSNGTYFKGMCGIGPMFGATFAEAKTFKDGRDAYRVWSEFPMTCDADLVNERGQKCDITGRPLRALGAKERESRG